MGSYITIRVNFEDEYRLIERTINDCKLSGILLPESILEIMVHCYRGEKLPDYPAFETALGEWLTSVVDSIASEHDSNLADVWNVGDLPRFYMALVSEVYPGLIKKLNIYSQAFMEQPNRELDSSSPFYALLHLELPNEQPVLNVDSIAALWRDAGDKGSV